MTVVNGSRHIFTLSSELSRYFTHEKIPVGHNNPKPKENSQGSPVFECTGQMLELVPIDCRCVSLLQPVRDYDILAHIRVHEFYH